MTGALKAVFAIAAFAASLGIASAAFAGPNCTCRYKGQAYALESCVCLTTSEGPRLACCGMVLNNTSWKFTEKHCPVVETEPPTINQSLAAWANKSRPGDRTIRRE